MNFAVPRFLEYKYAGMMHACIEKAIE